MDSKLTRDGLVFQSKNTAKLFEGSLSGFWAQNRAPLHLKTETVADTAFRTS